MSLERLFNWYQTALGKEVAAAENAYLNQVLTKLPGNCLLQLGYLPGNWLQASRIMSKYVLSEQVGDEVSSSVVAHFDTLPFASELFDVVVLAHIVDCKENYPAIISEATRVLSGEGHLLILGFNPFSLGALSTAKPALSCLTSFYKVNYWLRKLECEIESVNTFFYRPLIQYENILQKLKLLETMGQWLLPKNGWCYVISARKKIEALTPWRQSLENEWRYWMNKPIVEPSTNVRQIKL